MNWMCESILKLDWKITPNSLQQSNCSVSTSGGGGIWKYCTLGRLNTISFVLERFSLRQFVATQAFTFWNSTSSSTSVCCWAGYMFCCCCWFSPIPVRPIVSKSAGPNLRQIFRIVRTAAVDDQSKVCFLIRQWTLPWQPVFDGFIQ